MSLAEDSNDIHRRKVLKACGTSFAATAGLTGLGSAKPDTGPDKIPVPSGKLVDPSRVHSMGKAGKGVSPAEARNDRSEKSSQQAENESQATGTANQKHSSSVPDVHDWWLYTRDHFKNGEYSSMECDFNVPSEPSGYDAANDPTMFLFPALQNCDDFCTNLIYIIQPVLQWNWWDGSEGDVGGWSISSWYRSDDDGDYYHSTPINVSVGDSLWGLMRQDPDDSWYINTWNNTTGEYTDIQTDPYASGLSFDRAYTTLEVANYDPGTCKRLPGDTTFKNIMLDDSNDNSESPEWGKKKNGSAECNGLSINIKSDEKIVLQT